MFRVTWCYDLNHEQIVVLIMTYLTNSWKVLFHLIRVRIYVIRITHLESQFILQFRRFFEILPMSWFEPILNMVHNPKSLQIDLNHISYTIIKHSNLCMLKYRSKTWSKNAKQIRGLNDIKLKTKILKDNKQNLNR